MKGRRWGQLACAARTRAVTSAPSAPRRPSPAAASLLDRLLQQQQPLSWHWPLGASCPLDRAVNYGDDLRAHPSGPQIRYIGLSAENYRPYRHSSRTQPYGNDI